VAIVMDGMRLADRVRAEVAAEAAELGQVTLATVLVGDDPASHIYIGHKHRAASEVGIQPRDLRLPADSEEDEVLALVEDLNSDDEVDGVLVQLPLPQHMDEARVTAAIDPMKDVDGLHPFNAGQLYLGRRTFVPATPLGIMRLLDEYRIQTAGARAVVVGRSQIVGKPIAMLLLQGNATVTICHSQTDDLRRHTADADILVAAVGLAGVITRDMVKQGATVIDVGITRTDAGLVGDVDPGAAEVAGHISPVPGGVGPLTVSLLLENAVRAAKYRRGVLAFPRAQG
jgi:methylenetetrahydrofolate dehydrogenase (NADP+)/methenyltetrahydrofolate cyclohydrolase